MKQRQDEVEEEYKAKGYKSWESYNARKDVEKKFLREWGFVYEYLSMYNKTIDMERLERDYKYEADRKYNKFIEDAEYYVSDIHESEPERYQEEFGDVDEDEAVEKYLENYYENDDVQWYIDNFGKKQFTEVVKKNNLIDLNKLAEAIVDADGPANSLARYDGDEISLDCGYYCYRTN